MKNEKPKYCTRPEVVDCCLCEKNVSGFDCEGERIFIDLVEVLEEPEMVLEPFEDEDVLEEII